MHVCVIGAFIDTTTMIELKCTRVR